MEEYYDCNTTLRLGLDNQNHAFLDLSAPRRVTDREIIESSSSLKSKENERERSQEEEEEIDFFRNFGRKKLRLSKDQTTLLEDCFNQHSTLNTAQKQALAGKLCLKPRQVEVWFQNRRARSKLKQTEIECRLLKKNCERLSEENCRLNKELVELRSKTTPLQAQQRCSFPVPKAAKLERCPSCDKN